MRVLITNNTLAERAGTELYVRDLALELMRRGHSPVAYSTVLGKVADELRAATIPVISSLASLGESPDIIHGHHHYETVSALLWFPGTPAIHYCHGWLPWEETPLQHPAILRYVGVDELCRERLIAENGIPPEKTEVIANFFDPAKFPRRSPLPASPRRALLFANDVQGDDFLRVIRDTCAARGIELDVVGFGAGNPESETGALLGNYDLVFAKARAAIEAMAVGAAVMLYNAGRLGPMVTRGNFPSLRRFNFGIRTLAAPLSSSLLASELLCYDPSDAAGVTDLVREQCPLAPAADRIIALYGQVIAEARARPIELSVAAERAAASYLEREAPNYKFTRKAAELGFVDRDARIAVAEAALAAEREHAQAVAESLSQREAVLQNQVALLRDQVNTAKRDAAIFENRANAAEAEAALLRDRMQAAESRATELGDKLKVAQIRDAALTSESADRGQTIARLQQSLHDIRNSITWRWTRAVLENPVVKTLAGPAIRAIATSKRIA